MKEKIYIPIKINENDIQKSGQKNSFRISS